MKIAIYFDNSALPLTKVGDLKYGNPGIGGAEHQALFLMQLLSENTDYDLIIFLRKKIDVQFAKKSIKIKVIKFFNDVVVACNKMNIDILITRYIDECELFGKLEKTKVIIRQHDWVIKGKSFKLLSSLSCIKHIVFSSSQSYCRYLDYDINKKSLYIHPCYVRKECNDSNKPNANRVVYLGSLDPLKNVHHLTEAWPKVVKRYPDAHLTIIGSQRLWDSSCKLGSLGVATQEYEKRLLSPLIENNILNTVDFVGLKGIDKLDYIKNSDLGVLTLCKGETFCLSALDIVSCRRKVVCIRKYGFLESTTGRVSKNYKNQKHLANVIIKQLKKKRLLSENKIKYIDSFGVDSFIHSWIKLIDSTYKNTKCNLGRKVRYPLVGENKYRLFFRLLRDVFKLSERFNYDNFKRAIHIRKN